MSKFLSQICRLCSACKAKEPYFCSLMHSADRTHFAKTMKHIVFLKFRDKEKFFELTSFDAFVGIFCNNRDGCSFRAIGCASLDSTIECYKTFLNQSGQTLLRYEKAGLYREYSGIDLKDVGLKYRVPSDPLSSLSKKARKRMNRLVDKTIYSVETVDKKHAKDANKEGGKHKKGDKKKQTMTTFFCSNDKEWQEKIDITLGVNNQTNEANN